MRYASVCDGIGAVHVAWQPLGWECAWTSEIEAFPAAVVEQRHGYRNLGDMTKLTEEQLDGCGPVSLLVGGTPCQSFSVAGLRKGLADPRGNLALRFVQLVGVLRPTWVVWENVPGVLSSAGGRDFGTFLGALGELGYGFAYRVLDAQWFGVAQRRRRVFVVAHARDWRRAAAVLFERESLFGDPPTRGTQREETTGGTGDGVARCVTAVEAKRQDWETCTFVAHAIGTGSKQGCATAAVAFDTTQITSAANYSRPKPGDPCHPLASGAHPPAVAFTQNSRDEVRKIGGDGSVCAALTNGMGMHQTNFIAFANRTRGGVKVPEVMKDGVTPAITNPGDGGRSDAINVVVPQPAGVDFQNTAVTGELTGTLDAEGQSRGNRGCGVMQAMAFTTEQTPKFSDERALTITKQSPSGGGQPQCVMTPMAVRRLTPRECERLQGFPDDFTAITYRGKPAADGPRYKALGNSMAVPVMAWIGRRIAEVEVLP